MEELLALMQFMISRNDAHAQEPAEPADRLQTAGKRRAFRRIMDTAAGFDRANAQLDAVARELSEEAEKQGRSEARASDRFLRLRGLLLRKINFVYACAPEKMLSLRASAHTGVAIPRLVGKCTE